jgi:hypothetical protein
MTKITNSKLCGLSVNKYSTVRDINRVKGNV